jgi:hypothetical protein
MAKRESVPRPSRKSDFTVYFANAACAKGWRDLLAVRRNGLVDAWNYLTEQPEKNSELCYQLKDKLSTVTRGGNVYSVRQLKLSLGDGARIWYYIDGKSVIITDVFTSHPNQTK